MDGPAGDTVDGGDGGDGGDSIAPLEGQEHDAALAERPRATGPAHEGAPIGIAIGLVSAIGFAGLAFLMAFAFFAAVAIYALVKAIGGGEGTGNPVVVVLMTVFLLTLFVALLLVGIGKLGGSLTPKKRRKDA